MKDLAATRRVIVIAAGTAVLAVCASACGAASTAHAAAMVTQSAGTTGRGSVAAISASINASPSSTATSAARSRATQAATGLASPAAAQDASAAPRTPASESAKSAGQVAPASAAPVERGLLREFLTVNDAGYFYTAYTPEAQSAVSTFHFQPTGATFGYVDASRVTGTIPLYRLHDQGVQAYLVTPDVSEKNSLLASGKFTLDGVLGYIAAEPAAGTSAIWRVSKGPRPYWRLATTSQEKTLVAQGWHLDGLVGYVWAKA